MFNHVALLGRLAETPEVRQTTSGKLVTRFDLAVQVQGQKKETPPDYLPIVCWDSHAEFCERYLTKGKQVVVEGKLRTQKFTDKNGNNRKDIFVKADRIFFADSNNGNGTGGNAAPAPIDGTAPPSGGFEDITGEDDFPF